MMIKKLLFCLLILPAFSQAAHITDRLLAGMYSSADAENDPIKLLPSGTPLEILTEKNGFVQIQLVDGKEGWVEKRFLSADKPAKVRLLVLQGKYKQIQAEFDEAKKELTKLKKNTATKSDSADKERLVTLHEELLELKSRLEASELKLQKSQQTEVIQVDDVTETDSQTLSEKSDEAQSVNVSAGLSWIWLLILPLIFIPMGLYAGILLQDKRQRARHGGFRI